MNDEIVLLKHFDEFVAELRTQLVADDKRWGETFLRRTRKGQEERCRNSFQDKFDRFENAGIPIEWLKIAGDSYISWLREKHPEMSDRW
jgi:hypothetical protein